MPAAGYCLVSAHSFTSPLPSAALGTMLSSRPRCLAKQTHGAAVEFIERVSMCSAGRCVGCHSEVPAEKSNAMCSWPHVAGECRRAASWRLQCCASALLCHMLPSQCHLCRLRCTCAATRAPAPPPCAPGPSVRGAAHVAAAAAAAGRTAGERCYSTAQHSTAQHSTALRCTPAADRATTPAAQSARPRAHV
jgi:hypothetical protein